MLFYLLIILVISILEIRSIKKQKLKKELYFFIFSMILATILGVLYISNPLRKSLAGYILQLINRTR